MNISVHRGKITFLLANMAGVCACRAGATSRVELDGLYPEMCFGCAFGRGESPCCEADLFMAAMLKDGTRKMWQRDMTGEWLRTNWRFQWVVVSDGTFHVICREHRSFCVNCGLPFEGLEGRDIEVDIADMELPEPVDDCRFGHWQQEYVFQTYGFKPMLCSECLTVPVFEADPDFDQEQHRLRAGLRAWVNDSVHVDPDMGGEEGP